MAKSKEQEIPKGYKQTEIGVIPNDWDVIDASDACLKIQDGTHFSPKVNGSDFLYITSKNIRFGYMDLSSVSRISTAEHQAIYKRCDVRKGDLLLTKDGANTGNVAINKIDDEFSLLSSVAFLRFLPDVHNAAYFMQQILAVQGQRQIQDAMAGNAITRLTLGKIKRLRFSVPPSKQEEDAIARALSDADTLIEKTEKLIEKKKSIKQGAMQELLTGNRRLPDFSDKWVTNRLGNIFRVTRGQVLAMTKTTEYIMGESQYPVYSSQTKSNGLAGYYKDYLFQDCITWTTDGANAGDVKYRAGKFYCTNVCGVLESKEGYSNPCIAAIFNSISRKYVSYVGNPKLMNNVVADIEILMPKTVEEQTAISKILSDMDSEIEKLESQLAKYKNIKQGMMQNLLTGKIRLIKK